MCIHEKVCIKISQFKKITLAKEKSIFFPLDSLFKTSPLNLLKLLLILISACYTLSAWKCLFQVFIPGFYFLSEMFRLVFLIKCMAYLCIYVNTSSGNT